MSEEMSAGEGGGRGKRTWSDSRSFAIPLNSTQRPPQDCQKDGTPSSVCLIQELSTSQECWVVMRRQYTTQPTWPEHTIVKRENIGGGDR